MTDGRILLSGANVHITQSGNDAYKVCSGKLIVFVVRIEDGKPGRRTFLYEAGPGEIIPGFAYRDMNYTSLAFCFAALTECIIEKIDSGADDALRTDFARRANLGNYDIEGFEECVADCYRLNIMLGDSFIQKSRRDNAGISAGTFGLVGRALGRDDPAGSRSGDPLYDCTALLCRKTGVEIAPPDKVREMFGDDYTVYDIARLSHFAYREEELGNEWYTKNTGPFMAEGPGGTPVLCVGKKNGRSFMTDPQTSKTAVVTSENAAGIGKKAFMISRALPAGKLEAKDIAAFCLKCVSKVQLGIIIAAMIILPAALLVMTLLARKAFDEIIPSGSIGKVAGLAAGLAAIALVYGIFMAVRNIIRAGIGDRIAFSLQNALYYRLFNMPEAFFRENDPSVMAGRIVNAGRAAGESAENIITIIAAGLLSAAAAAGIFVCAGGVLFASAMAVLVLTVAIWILCGRYAASLNAKIRDAHGKLDSILNQYVGGIESIRVSGAENRAMYEYMNAYVEMSTLEDRRAMSGRIAGVFTVLVCGLFIASGFMLFPEPSGNAGGNYAAFCILAFVLAQSVERLGRNIARYIRSHTEIRGIKELVTWQPECANATVTASGLTGAIELSGVSFAYSDDSPKVLEDLNLSIKAGEYVGIAGPSGCGKTTLIKLLLGFENPTSGRIYYDNKDLGSIDRSRLRRNIGVVLQEDKLLAGNILDNIRVTAPGASDARIMRAIRASGLEEDINKLPMGLMTIVDNDGGGFSDGLYQRIMIARAIISNPKILIFDEAAGNLDGPSGERVKASLASMSCTRIVVSHRPGDLSGCDRIIYLEKGRIARQSAPDML